jgi:hypothetical protein
MTSRRPGFLPLLVAGGVTLMAPATHAQDASTLPQRDPWIVTVSHWGRWPALAAAAGLITAAAISSNNSKETLNTLEDYCREDFARCSVIEGPDGPGYADPGAEELYQEYAAQSREARGYLLGGQASMLLAGALFLIDLVHHSGNVEDIPYTPFELYTTPSSVGLAVRF